ncbi:MAG: NosD domain-containing protein, partial [Thermoplasmata archaeon]
KEHFNTHEIAENNTVRGKPIVYIKNCENLTLDAMEAAQIILANCSGFRLSNLSIARTETALELAFVQNGIVSSSYFSKSYVGILQLYASNATYRDVTISEAAYQAARIRHSDFTRFSHSTVRSSHEGIVLSFSHNFTVRDVSFLSIMGSGISSMYSSDIQVENSSFHEMMYGLNHWKGDALSVLWNEFTYIETAIEISHANDSVVGGNFVADSGRALWLDSFHRGTVKENNIHDIRIRGFEIWYSTNSTWNKNRIDYVSESGFLMRYSANNTLTENSIIGSLSGIGILNSKSNKIHHNNLINNSIQAYDSSANDNEWDDGYPSGGNYWSNYTGPDDFSGPNQNVPGPDGIRDVPFDFDPDTMDDYPLIDPIVATPSEAPRNLTANLSGKGFENITLSWSLSIDDLNGQRSVVGYDILRGRNYSSDLSDYASHALVPKGTSQYVDVGAGEGDPDNHFYVICAVDSSGNSSCSRKQAGKFTERLSEGPNLVSVPLLQINTTTELVLQTVTYDKAWYYDTLSQEWKSHVTHESYRRGLWHINHSMAVWVNVTRESNLTVAGIVPAQTVIYLGEGWNLASFPSFGTSYTISDLKAEIGATRVEGYESVSPHYLRVLGDAETLLAGYGYWVRVETDTVWIVEVS